MVDLVQQENAPGFKGEINGAIPAVGPNFKCPVSSAVEQLPYTERVGGSIPSPGTNFAVK